MNTLSKEPETEATHIHTPSKNPERKQKLMNTIPNQQKQTKISTQTIIITNPDAYIPRCQHKYIITNSQGNVSPLEQNNFLVNDYWAKVGINTEIKEFLEFNESE